MPAVYIPNTILHFYTFYRTLNYPRFLDPISVRILLLSHHKFHFKKHSTLNSRCYMGRATDRALPTPADHSYSISVDIQTPQTEPNVVHSSTINVALQTQLIPPIAVHSSTISVTLQTPIIPQPAVHS